MTKNKFAYPPYLPDYDSAVAVKLSHILRIISNSCCKFQTVEGARTDLDLLISRPSQIRKCDLPRLREVVKAIKELKYYLS